MTAGAAVAREGRIDVLSRLEAVCAGRGLDVVAGRLSGLAELPRHESIVARSATHLLDLGGKRLRPMCVALAARAGAGFDERARQLAVAVELVHSATLLHDDVVDLGDRRRGAAAARAIWGNAASIFAGDWLLVEALRRVRRARVDGLLDRLLAVIEEMIFAEAVQLEQRGRFLASRAAYLRVVEGKTASLFRWAMLAGGRAGGLDDRHCHALESYGLHLGVAFQAIDDVLDLTGDARTTGKALFADLREGKVTYPLIVALEREPSLRGVLEQIASEHGDSTPPETLSTAVLDALVRTRATEECLGFARSRATDAVLALEPIAHGASRAALETIAMTVVSRRR